MSLITAVEITNLFLYGQRTKPINFVDESLIRPQDYKYSLALDINEYMNGPGQFATLDKFKVVQEFFNTPILGLSPGVYTKEDLYALFNITNIQDKIVTINQLGYGTSDPGFVDRAYIWGTTAFQLHNTTRFIISATGERSIVDYAVDPYLGDRNHESFDFASNTFTTQVADAFLEPRIDPSGIGREVIINFSGNRQVNNSNFTATDFSNLQSTAPTSNLVVGASIAYGARNAFTQNLFDSAAKTLDEFNRPIFYGSNGTDVLSETFSASDAPLLYPYKSNGVVLIGGWGDDVLVGGDHADKLIGGEGFSTYYVGNGDTIIDVTSPDPTKKSDGVVIFDNIELIGGTKKLGQTDYQDTRGNHFSLSGTNLTVTNVNTNISLVIENFKNHDLGINLEEFFVNNPGMPVTFQPTIPRPTVTQPIYTPPPPVAGKIWEPIIIVSPDGTSFTDSGRRILVWPGSAPHYEDSNGVPIKKDGDNWVPKNTPLPGGGMPEGSAPTGPVKPLTDATPVPWTGPRTDPNAPYTSPADKNGNGIPDIHESTIDPATKTANDAAKKVLPPRRDPLTLDLDGDGLETIGIAATNPILFDHDGDGIKNGTGWVAPDDGFLVRDVNGNGTIDSGRELFGDSTIKSNGQTATDGFDALADLDSNLDGKISSLDAQFANLRLWRDLNQDGISQTGELFTLTQLNISSINVTKTANSQTLANGNQIADLGSFTRTDGSTGTAGAVTGNLADINLASDTFHRTFPNVLDTTSVATLPDMQGSGAVRDLREAANDEEWRVVA